MPRIVAAMIGCVAICLVGVAEVSFATPKIDATPKTDATPKIAHVLLISVDGLHPVDVANYVRAKPQSALAGLMQTAITYTTATTPIPSDSYPGLLALVTGGSPKTTGILYDEFYDRELSPPNSRGTCATIGTTVRFDKVIEIDPTRVDGGGGIDPAKLPRDPNGGCRPVYPHNALRVNTVFEVIRAGGGRTAWSDKHLSYEIVNGPSGTGVDDLFDPEIAANNVSAKIATTQSYDDTKVNAVLSEIRGFDHTGTKQAPVPTIFGLNFQAVATAQVTQGNGYLDAAGTPSPGLATALDHVDASIGEMIAALTRAGLRSTTAIIVTAKHGQSPIDPAKLRYVSPALIRAAVDRVGPSLVLKQNQGDGVLLWLTDRSKTQAVVEALRADASQAGFADVFSGPALSSMLASPQTDSRAPDILVRTLPGVLYLPVPRIAAHGGINVDDRSVALVVSEPGIRPETIVEPVSTTQVAPTILDLLGFAPNALQAVVREGTRVLPGLARLSPNPKTQVPSH